MRLIGPNGAGKSTLLRTVSGMQPMLGGRVTLLGRNLHSISPDQRARHLSIVLTQKMDIGLFTGYGLVAMGRQPEIKIHVKGALANGVTRDEIRELMVHAFLYCGIPMMVDAMRAAEGVLDEAEAK